MNFKHWLLSAAAAVVVPFGALAQDPVAQSSDIFRVAPCDQSYFSIDLSEFKFKGGKKGMPKEASPYLYVKLVQGEREFTRILNMTEFDVDGKTATLKTKHNVPVLGPFPYTGEPIQLDVKLYAASGKALEMAFKLVDDVSVQDANQWVGSHHLSDLLEEPVEALIEQSVQNGETKLLSAFSRTWMREASFTSLVDFSIAREGFFVMKPIDAHKEHADAEKRYFAYGALEGIPDNEKGDTCVVVQLKQDVNRPDLRAFEDYYTMFSQAEKAAQEKDAVRMEYYYDMALHYIYANDNFTWEDKVDYHIDEYNYLLEIIKVYIKDYKGRTLPDKPCSAK